MEGERKKKKKKKKKNGGSLVVGTLGGWVGGGKGVKKSSEKVKLFSGEGSLSLSLALCPSFASVHL